MNLTRTARSAHGRRSIFRALFIPMFLIMILQALIFYFVAMYGGINESLHQNAADILSERLVNRKNELETRFNNRWSALDECSLALGEQYAAYEAEYGREALTADPQLQIQFLSDSAGQLVDTLRHNEVNGIFLILNDETEQSAFPTTGSEQKYGLCIRDMDQESNYSGREDLLLERAPSSIVDALGCSLDSWWEARYCFDSEAEGAYYYLPLNAAWENPGAGGRDLAYCSGVHQISGSDPGVVSYSLPLIAEDGYPYGVLGVELSTRYLASLLPNKELNEADKSCYVLALQDSETQLCTPIVSTGALYSRCFGSDSVLSVDDRVETGGFTLTGREGTVLYGTTAALDIYNNNNPFEGKQLTLLALVEQNTLFSYVSRVKGTLMLVSLISLVLGLMGLLLVSRRFAAPITALAKRVRGGNSRSDLQLERLGITEIDQLVDAIEELNRNVSKNIARTEFFSRMSHDMRTPMNAIISFSSPELLEGADEGVKDDYLGKINASGQYLLGLINEVLDMTKIESNRTELHLEDIRATQLFETPIPIIEKLAQAKDVTFVTDLALDEQTCVQADTQHLDQIVMNLLSNAVKFTPEGGTVRLTAEMGDDPADPARVRCHIVVADTGIGMSRAFMKNLYTPFEQENSRREGTGLGLSIAKKLVELMGGTINCVSRQNIGTTFTVDLPLSRCERAAAGPDTGLSATPDPELLRGRHVLVCEDNGINTEILCHLLERWGISAETTPDGRAGVETFAAAPPGTFDAILMDIRMPIMDGLAATRAIRALPRPDAATIPILAMTANAFAEDVQASADAGMNAHLAKPIEPRKFFAVLRRYLL